MRIHPLPAEEVHEIHGDVSFPGSHPEDPSLPYVAINMVSSLDGKTSAGGKSGSIGSPVDREVMRTLRSKADAVMAGAGTLRAEKASLTTEGRRSPEPFAILASRTLDLPTANLLHAESERAMILTQRGGPGAMAEERRGRLERLEREGFTVVEEEGLGAALRKAKSSHGIGSILLEGGPSLNHALAKEGLVSEIFLTLSPKTLGGESKGIMQGGETSDPREKTLLSVHKAYTPSGAGGSELFLRYRIPHASGAGTRVSP